MARRLRKVSETKAKDDVDDDDAFLAETKPATREPEFADDMLVTCKSCNKDFTFGEADDVKLVGVHSFTCDCPLCGEKVEHVGTPIDSRSSTEPVGEITVCWGEEKYFPDPQDRYSSFTAGSVFLKVFVRPGETYEDAGKRAYKSAEALGEEFRRRKLKSYLKALRSARKGTADDDE